MAVPWLCPHKRCLCDLKATTHNVHSVPIISVLYMAAEAGGGVLLDWLSTPFMSWAALNSHIPAWQ